MFPTADSVTEAAEESRALIDAMLEGNALELLSNRLPTFNETIEEEAAAVHNCLEVFENMVEVSDRERVDLRLSDQTCIEA